MVGRRAPEGRARPVHISRSLMFGQLAAAGVKSTSSSWTRRREPTAAVTAQLRRPAH
jgi:hypothetical protein